MTDYKQTVFLPRTSFSMRGNLKDLEPRMLKRWEGEDLYKKMREQSKGRPKFILHLGPPYANGHLHIGHAFTGIFKDVVVRHRQMLGFDAPLVPGWDCHGLPIEWAVEERYRKAKKNKDEVPLIEFRDECRSFAHKWITVQREESKRLGINADWKNPYITMDYDAEAATAEELLKVLEAGLLYKGVKPVLWSVVEKTALAEAEVDYRDHVSTSLYARFPLHKSPHAELEGASALIWTTTPWSLPGNRALAYHPDEEYVLFRVVSTGENSLAQVGESLLVAKALKDPICQIGGILESEVLATYKGQNLSGTVARHCLHEEGYSFDVPFLPGSHVTVDTGTGLVHTAPGHGPEDFALGKEYGLEVPRTVGEDGYFYDHVPCFAGLHVYKASSPVLDALKNRDRLFQTSQLTHSYPHSWRSKAPLIYRATAQWFLDLRQDGLLEKSLAEIKKVDWFPASAERRLTSMVSDRPDWCLSRQRAWGVPLTLFVHKETGDPLCDPQVNARILEALTQEGCDAWFTSDPQCFLGDAYQAEDYEQVRDVLDVWFDSGASQNYVLEAREDLQRPADLYLEGSDQHRGWFQSSLLLGVATRGTAPYKGVVSHGFALDAQGQKMSKSQGNVVSPQKIIDQSGAEMLRLWMIHCDYSDDYRIGPEILKRQQDIYRRFRNTLRYLLGALDGFQQEERIPYQDLPDLEKYILHRVSTLGQKLRQSVEEYTFQSWFNELHHFCSVDLSSFYFDVRKDSLYCDSQEDLRRRSCRTVFEILLTHLITWVAPVLCFTAEEAWQAWKGEEAESIHLQRFSDVEVSWISPELETRFDILRAQRRVMTGALEKARAQDDIRSSLQATLTLYDPDQQLDPKVDYAELAIVSGVEILPERPPQEAFQLIEGSSAVTIGVVVKAAEGEKCERCWQVLPEVGFSKEHPTLCRRCDSVVS